jgi:hypothetical protein
MGILVDLLPCFKDKPENIATRGLHAILKHREGLTGFQEILTEKCGWRVPIHTVNAQVNLGVNGQPDLEGLSASGDRIFLGEVKFWAGLTKNQPLSYLSELAPGGLLLFIVPKTRRQAVWDELRRRVPDRLDESAFKFRTQNKWLALLSGQDVLECLIGRAIGSGSKELAADIVQLASLWCAYDVPDLPPISDEFATTSLLPRILSGLNDIPGKIANAAIEQLKAERWQPAKKTAPGPYANLKIGKLRGWVIFSQENWKAYEMSPIWFETHRDHNPDFDGWDVVERVFASHAGRTKSLSSKKYNEYAGCICTPLRLRANVAEPDVIEGILDELRSIKDSIETLPT